MNTSSFEKCTYIAITIGPIFDTMSLVSTPAALWASSYMFSYISKRLREELIESGVDNDAFITPYMKDDTVLERNPGVGMLPDHIIFKKPKGFTFAAFELAKQAVIEDVNKKFHIHDLKFLSEYIMISAVEYEASNPIMESNGPVNALELAKAFVAKEKCNPLLEYFTNDGSDTDKNNAIKVSAMQIIGNYGQDWQLLDRMKNIRQLEHIARAETTDNFKRHRYYAIIRSDGDNVGKTISELTNADEFHSFSESCISFCEGLAALVKEFMGVTIYAGGDDLLAILPCESGGDKHLFRFVRRANALFKDKLGAMFEAANKARREKNPNAEEYEPSLTFGITVAHYKYPLYEALEDSAELLFGVGKRIGGYKNAVLLRLIKHSGQTSTVWIHNDVLSDGVICTKNALISLLDRAVAGGEASNDLLLSAFHKVAMFKQLFNSVDKAQVVNLFKNTFDDTSHQGSDFLHKELPELFGEHILSKRIFALDANGSKLVDPSAALNSLMRIVKFYVEEAGEEK